MWKACFLAMALVCVSNAQTHTGPALDTNNAYTGNNTYGGTETFNGNVLVKNLNNIHFADQFGDKSTTGIAGAITDCGSSVACQIFVAASYPTTETVPGFVPSFLGGNPGANTSKNISIKDFRYGENDSFYDPYGYSALNGAYANYRSAKTWTFNYFQGPNNVAQMNHVGLNLNFNVIAGGFNFNENGYVNKETYAPIDLRVYAYSPAQKYGVFSNIGSFSPGDEVGFFGNSVCYAGLSSSGDEGCEGLDSWISQGNVEYTGTIAVTSTGATSLTVTPTAGAYTQGAQRILIDTTTGKVSAGTVSAITFTNGTTPLNITGSGTGWATSSVNTTLGTAVTAPGVATVTPASMTGITTSTNLVIADNGAYEKVTPSETTGTTFTANFRYAHSSTAIVASGGMSGYYIALTADNATTGTFGSTSTVNFPGNVGGLGLLVNTLHWIIPVIRTTSGTSMDVWLVDPDGPNQYRTYNGRWASGATSTYVAYQGAESTSVANAQQQLSNTFTLEANSVPWTSGDVVAEPQYTNISIRSGIIQASRFTPGASGSTSVFFPINLYGMWQSGETGIGLTNFTPTGASGLYGAYNAAGTLSPPWGYRLIGPWARGLMLDTTPISGGGLASNGTGAGIIYLTDSSTTNVPIYSHVGGGAIWEDTAGKNFGFGTTFGAGQFEINWNSGTISRYLNTVTTGNGVMYQTGNAYVGDAPILEVNGSKTAPSYSFTGATNYGQYFRSNVLETAINGVAITQTNNLGYVIDGGFFLANGPVDTTPASILVSSTAPTISSGFGTSPSIATNNGTAAFTVNVGTGGTATSGVIGLPTAVHGWNCFATDITTNSATVFITKQTASSTTSCTIGNFNTSAAAAAWAASDILSVSAFAR